MNTFNPHWEGSLLQQRKALLQVQPSLEAFFVAVHDSSAQLALPFLPLRAFRLASVYSARSPPLRTFRSSGSTQAMRASHSFSQAGMESYSEGACAGFDQFLNRFHLPSNLPILSLVPSEQVWKESSLAAMMSMFQRQALVQNRPFHFLDLDSRPESFFRLFNSPEFSKCLIFGTSFHHVQLSEFASAHSQYQAQNSGSTHELVVVVDTGGTKGRTQSFTVQEIENLTRSVYGPARSFQFLSEYGMCELASQAYSLEEPHTNAFQCNCGLWVFAVNLETGQLCSPHEPGFLAFYDVRNSDSYSAIITEDVGLAHSAQTFTLLGRAPDASLKGCSLNVRRNFFFQSPCTAVSIPQSSGSNKVDLTLPAQLNVEKLLQALPVQIWDAFSKNDLAASLATWHALPPQLTAAQNATLQKKPILNLGIVASANIPITWLHAAGVAASLGANKVDLYLPSLRADDPLSHKVRAQIKSLAKALNPYLDSTNLEVHDKGLPDDSKQLSHLVVFGSNDTVETFSERLKGSQTRFVGLGDVRNSVEVPDLSDATASHAATQCALWWGRGCLTPVVVFAPCSQVSHAQQQKLVQTFAQTFSEHLEREFEQRLKAVETSGKFFHRHAKLEAQWRFALASSPASLFAGGCTLVVNALNLTEEQIESANFEFESGGMGLVTLLPNFLINPQNTAQGAFTNRISTLSSENTTPGIWETHNGKTWLEWFLENP